MPVLVSIKAVIFLIFCLMSTYVNAQLMISPTRVVLDERQRSAKITLINPTNQTRTYRLKWEEKIALPTGGYQTLSTIETADNSVRSASPMLRISPKQVTLKPNEKQTIRVMFRRPKNLADGEYRSHLSFNPLPLELKKSGTTTGVNLNLEALLAFTIPVIARQGQISTSINFTDIKIRKKMNSKEAQVEIGIERTGLYSATGNVLVYWQADSRSDEMIVAQTHGYNLYPDQPNYQLTLPWLDFNAASGKLRVEYVGQKEFAGQILAEKTFDFATHLIH